MIWLCILWLGGFFVFLELAVRSKSDPDEAKMELAGQFWAKVDICGPEECWPWRGGRRVRGYGGMKINGKPEISSRIAFFLTHGRWPENARHSCDFEPCCNPAHILEGDHQANMDDKVARGRQARGEAVKQSNLTVDDVRAIRRDPRSHKDVAPFYGVDKSTICRIRNHKTWRHVHG